MDRLSRGRDRQVDGDSQVEFWQNLEKNASQIMIFLIYKMWGRKKKKKKVTEKNQKDILYNFIQNSIRNELLTSADLFYALYSPLNTLERVHSSVLRFDILYSDMASNDVILSWTLSLRITHTNRFRISLDVILRHARQPITIVIEFYWLTKRSNLV